MELTVHHLRFDLCAHTHIGLGEQPGQQLRGALFGALRRHYCPAPNDPAPGHSVACPVCWLLAREDERWWRGRNPVRPYALVPPVSPNATASPSLTLYQPGDTFSFGITLFGHAIHLFPFLVLALPAMGRDGVGIRLRENNGRRGRFTLVSLDCVNLLTGETQTLLAQGTPMVQMPTLSVGREQVLEVAARWSARGERTLRLHFLTPTRLISGKRLLHQPLFRPLFGRLVDRLEGLAQEYGEVHGMDVKPALAAAEQVRLVHDATVWRDLDSHSTRTDRSLPVGGFVGHATYTAPDWRPLLPWLIWGTLVQVGKNTVKGEGVIALEPLITT